VTDASSFPDVFDSETITVSDQVTVKIISSPTTTSISALGVPYGTAATATVSVSSSGGTVAGTVTLRIDGGAASSMALTGGSAIFNLGALSAGGHNLAARFASQGAFDASGASGTITISQTTPTITWANPAPITYGTTLSGTQLNATASVPVTFVYNPPAGTLLSAGSQTLSLSFSPTDLTDYTTATAQVSLIVNQTTATVSVTGGTFTYDGSPHAGSGFVYGVGGVSDVQTPAVSLSYVGTGTTTYGPSATGPTNAGTYRVTASFAGNANYSSASNLAPITIIKANQTITLTGVPSTANFGQGPYSLSASATSGLTVALSATGNCSLSANSLSLTGVGSCTVTATQGGNSNYNAAPTLSPTFAIGPAPTMTNASVSPVTVKYSDYTTLTATVTPMSAGGQSLAGSVQFYLNDTAAGSPVGINS